MVFPFGNTLTATEITGQHVLDYLNNEYPGYVDTGFVDADVLREFIEKNSPIRVADYQPEG